MITFFQLTGVCVTIKTLYAQWNINIFSSMTFPLEAYLSASASSVSALFCFEVRSLFLDVVNPVHWLWCWLLIQKSSPWRLKLSRHAQGGPLLLLKSLFISRNWIFHAVIKICRSSLPRHRLLLIWESSDQIHLRCSSLSWDLKDEGWHFPLFCKLMPLICLTRTKLGFKIPNDKEIKTLNGFPKGNLYCKAPSWLLNFQLEFLIGYWLKWIKCYKW